MYVICISVHNMEKVYIMYVYCIYVCTQILIYSINWCLSIANVMHFWMLYTETICDQLTEQSVWWNLMADHSGQWCTQMPTCLSRSIQMIANEWPAADSSVFRDGCGVYTLYSLVYQLQGGCAWVKFVVPPFAGDTESLALVIARFCAFWPILVAIVGKMESHRI